MRNRSLARSFKRPSPGLWLLAALLWASPQVGIVGSQRAAAMNHQVALFTGFLAQPGAGMDILHSELSTAGIPNYLGRVFAWTEQQEAFDWIQQFENERSTLVLIGHSFGGNSALLLANDYLKPIGVDVDLTVQVDSVAYSSWNDQLPTNVDVGCNYYQSPGFLEPPNEANVQGATNINVEELLNDTSITHTSIDNDPRVHDLIAQNIFGNLNLENADFDSNTFVNGIDFLTWQENFGAVDTAVLSTGDANGDKDVDDEDFDIWQQQFGNVPEMFATFQQVPEPASLLLIITTGIGALAYHRWRGVWLVTLRR